jgi:hypothetical protein
MTLPAPREFNHKGHKEHEEEANTLNYAKKLICILCILCIFSSLFVLFVSFVVESPEISKGSELFPDLKADLKGARIISGLNAGWEVPGALKSGDTITELDLNPSSLSPGRGCR